MSFCKSSICSTFGKNDNLVNLFTFTPEGLQRFKEGIGNDRVNIFIFISEELVEKRKKKETYYNLVIGI